MRGGFQTHTAKPNGGGLKGHMLLSPKVWEEDALKRSKHFRAKKHLRFSFVHTRENVHGAFARQPFAEQMYFMCVNCHKFPKEACIEKERC